MYTEKFLFDLTKLPDGIIAMKLDSLISFLKEELINAYREKAPLEVIEYLESLQNFSELKRGRE